MHSKRNNKESQTYVQGLRSFGNTLPRGVKTILKKNGYNYTEIISKWKLLVGKEISDYSYPKSIKMKKGSTHGTLVIAVNRGNEITVEYSKNEIINKINSYFGYQLINEIKLETFNTENNEAVCPDDTVKQAKPPSNAAILFSNTSLVGFIILV